MTWIKPVCRNAVGPRRRGHACDLGGEGRRALACFREAQRLAPRDKITEVYVLALLAELGHGKEAFEAIRAAAPRHGVDVARLDRELSKAGFPRDARTVVSNAFIRARNFVRSRLADEAERIRNRQAPGRARARGAAPACRLGGAL